VIIVTTAIGIAVIGLVIAVITISRAPSTSISGTPGTSISGTPSTSARWVYTIGARIYSVPAVAGGTVYIGSDDDNVYALDVGS
jgi:hypothetical protein